MSAKLPRALTLCLLLSPILAATSMAEPVSLSELLWKNRLIVVFAVEGSAEANTFDQWVEANNCRLKGRDVIVFSIGAGSS